MIPQSESIEVRAPAGHVYGLIARDVVTPSSHPDSRVVHKPLGPGPLRTGFKYIATNVHDRLTCVSEWEAVDVRPGVLVEARSWHFCSVAKSEVHGGERWELAELDGRTRVTLTHWRQRGWLEHLFGGRSDAVRVSLRKRLSNVQYRAERS